MNDKELMQVATERLSLDTEAGKLYWKDATKYHSEKIGKEAGTIRCSRGEKRRYVKINSKYYPSARIIFLMCNGYLPYIVDHKNRNTLDNRPSNLRAADYTLNARNHSRRNIRKTANGKYQARLGQKSVGNYDSMLEAEKAYDKARKLQWGT